MKVKVTVIRILFLALFFFLTVNGKMMLWLALFAVSLLAALLFGRIYCGYVCPMNTLMIPVDRISKKLNSQRAKTPKWLQSGKFAWVALVLSVVVMLVFKRFLKTNLPILFIWLILSVIITIMYEPAVFHNLICPFGALQRVFGKNALRSKKVDKEKCIGCKLCEKVCPTDAISVYIEDKKADINTAACLQCTECKEVCPKDAIQYGKG